MNMKLPIEDIYVLPLEWNEPVQRERFEKILEKIFSYYENDGMGVVWFLERYYDKECRNQAITALGQIEISPDEMKDLQTENINVIKETLKNNL